MSKTHRLQVMLEHEEYQELVEVARRHRVTVSEWVRRALRELSLREPATGPDVKLGLVREAALGSYPTADIDQMLAEIDRGYLGRAG